MAATLAAIQKRTGSFIGAFIVEKRSYNGYYIIDEFTNTNSGNGMWTFAKKTGKVYFLKEFLKPVFPMDKSIFSEKTYKEKIDACENFEKQKRKFYQKINDASDGNIARIQSFFRQDSKYYITMEKIYGLNYTPRDVCNLSYEQQMLFCRVLAHSLMKLHQAGIIHADIKWDNIVFAKGGENKTVTVKLIDFDNSFIIGQQPDSEMVGIDPVYCAPETFKYMSGEPLALDFRIDIYALGIIFHQIFTGCIPTTENISVKDGSHSYIFEGLLRGDKIKLDARLPEFVETLIRDMLKLVPYERPSAQMVFERLCNPQVIEHHNDDTESYKREESETKEERDEEVKEDDEETLRKLWIDQHKAVKENGKWFSVPGDLNR